MVPCFEKRLLPLPPPPHSVQRSLLPQLSHRPAVAVAVDMGVVVDTGVGLAVDTAVGLAAAAFVAVDLAVVDSAVVRLAVSAAGLLDSVGPR